MNSFTKEQITELCRFRITDIVTSGVPDQLEDTQQVFFEIQLCHDYLAYGVELDSDYIATLAQIYPDLI